MQTRKYCLIIALIVLSLIFSAFPAMADITNGETIIDTPIPGDVTGNSNSTGATNLSTDISVPQSSDPQDVHNNNLTINNNVSGDAYGGLSYGSGAVYSNAITMNSSAAVNGHVYGGYSDNIGVVTNNIVKIYGTANGSVYGGYAGITEIGVDDDRSGISGSTNIYATASTNVSNTAIAADGNSVTLGNNVTVSGDLYAGYAALNIQGGTAKSGTISMDNTIPAYATATISTIASSNTLSADGNSVAIKDNVNVSGDFYGGYADLRVISGDALGGKVDPATAFNSTGYAYTDATATFIANDNTISANANRVTLGNNVAVSSDLYGGYAALRIQGGTLDTGNILIQNVATGYAHQCISGNVFADNAVNFANSNNVILGDNFTASRDLYGGYAALSITGITANRGFAFITVTVSRYFPMSTSADVSADNATSCANNNNVTLGDNLTVLGHLYGGYADLNITGGTINSRTGGDDVLAAYTADLKADNATVTADNNNVAIGNNGTVFGDIYGGYAVLSIQGGTSDGYTPSSISTANITSSADLNADNATATADNNNVTIGKNVTVSGDIYGGYAALSIQGGMATGGNTPSAAVQADNDIVSANYNSVTFDGNLATGNIYGGYALFEITDNVIGSSATAIDNTIVIGSNAALSVATSLYGGYLKYNAGYLPTTFDVFTDNSLNISGKHAVDGIYNFEYLGFTIPDGFTLSDTLIIASSVDLDEYNIGTGSTVTDINSSGILTAGNTYTLITVTGGGGFNGTITNTEASGVFNVGFISGTYEWINVGIYGNALTATLAGITTLSVKPETNALGEGFAAGLAFLGQAADLRSSLYFVPQGPRFIPFAKMVYGSQYINIGSSIKVEGFSAIAGLALNTNFDNGSQLVVGAFIEGGWGDYNSRNSFSNSTLVKGQGDTEYSGGGLLARYALKSGLYSEGTFAAGKSETDFRTRDLVPSGTSKYDYSVPYYSVHLTVGQVLNLTDLLDLDVYGKYLWTRQNGDNVTVNGDRFKFKDADSHRFRVGGKLHADVTPQLQPYVGAAYEYEFSGKIMGNLYGINMDKSSLRGGTGIGELGLVWTPTDAQNLKVDLGLQGYAGKREGLSGGLTVSLSF